MKHTNYVVLSYRFVSCAAFNDVVNELVAYLFRTSCGHFTIKYRQRLVSSVKAKKLIFCHRLTYDNR